METTKTPLTQIFRESAAAAHAAFPEKLENLLVLVTSSETPIYVAPEIADHVTKNVAAVKQAVKEATEYMQTFGAAGFSRHDGSLTGIMIREIALNGETSVPLSPWFTGEMYKIAEFDHEIGHLVVKNGCCSSSTVSEHLAECAADAYAALRHVQRFKETDFLDYYSKADQIVMDLSPIHYTDDVMQRVRSLMNETDITGLSLSETAALAGKIAQDYSLDDTTLQKISTAFEPAAAVYEERGWGSNGNAVLKECIEVMRKYQNDPDIYAAGKRLLDRPDIKNTIETLAKTDPYWQNPLDFMAHPPPKKEGFLKRLFHIK